MARLRRLRRALTAVVVTYAAGALLALTQPPRFEVFPFFCWFLFPVSPYVEERFALRVEQVGGEPLPEPRFYEALGLTKDPWAMDAYVNVQQLGAAVTRGDAEEAARLRRRIEAHFLPTPARYALVKVRFEVLERWREGALREATVVAVYTSDDTRGSLASAAGAP